MFGSDSFPLGPNGQFPRVRQRSYGARLNPPQDAQGVYLSGGSTVSKLPNLERDFHASNAKVKGRLMGGAVIRNGGFVRQIDRFKPRYAPFFFTRGRNVGVSGEDFEDVMDTDPIYDTGGSLMDEGETDDSVGFYNGGRGMGVFAQFADLFKRGVAGGRGVRRIMPTGTAVMRRR